MPPCDGAAACRFVGSAVAAWWVLSRAAGGGAFPRSFVRGYLVGKSGRDRCGCHGCYFIE